MTIYKTGDAVFFSGKGLFSTLIQLKTWCKISHVGIVVVEDGEPMIYESTTMTNLPDIETGKFRKGVQKHPLKERIANYDGKVYHAPITVALPNEKEALEWLNQVHAKNTKYDWKQAVLSGFLIKHFVTKENFDMLFCSELYFKFMKKAGVISNRFNASKKNPKDILTLTFIDEMLTRN